MNIFKNTLALALLAGITFSAVAVAPAAPVAAAKTEAGAVKTSDTKLNADVKVTAKEKTMNVTPGVNPLAVKNDTKPASVDAKKTEKTTEKTEVKTSVKTVEKVEFKAPQAATLKVEAKPANTTK